MSNPAIKLTVPRKFRGKAIDGEYWVFGDLLNVYDGTKDICYWDTVLVEPETNSKELQLKYVSVHPETVGLFTGKLDINKVEVYEGDIVSGKFSYAKKGVIEWMEARCSFHIAPIEGGFAAYDKGYKLNSNRIEVIGTIHD